MSLQPVGRASAFAPAAQVAAPGSPVAAAVAPVARDDEALEFVRFCYRRRRVGWPALYDEMSAVAARGAFRGMGYAELAEHGITFCLDNLPGLVVLAERVAREEQPITEPPATTISLSPTTA